MTRRDDIERFRSSQHSAYCAQHDGTCEVDAMLRSVSRPFAIWAARNTMEGLEVHHVFGRHGGKAGDSFCNLIRISKAAHSFAEEGTGDPNPVLLCEAVCLACKFARHQQVVAGPTWHHRSGDILVKYWDTLAQPWPLTEPEHQWHWHPATMDAVRATGQYRTLAARVGFLHETLYANVSPARRDARIGDITAKLVGIVGDA